MPSDSIPIITLYNSGDSGSVHTLLAFSSSLENSSSEISEPFPSTYPIFFNNAAPIPYLPLEEIVELFEPSGLVNCSTSETVNLVWKSCLCISGVVENFLGTSLVDCALVNEIKGPELKDTGLNFIEIFDPMSPRSLRPMPSSS
ncbi:hypothetical protein WICMUC_004748 [Wickerhamomyces mucosus]|uniref:Uncharacterized protein n=1 Tax=Wickerhamomyces mucosus TaxID=1378264 RepID=A0A9P8PFZ7_9ASCO|nr:hypothetical protein WICMUC_004748 [Wickerhamomyces mucosus]